MNRETCPLAKGAAIICSWSALEPAEGRFEFERQIGDKLREADKNGYHVSLAVWTSPNEITPQWLYDAWTVEPILLNTQMAVRRWSPRSNVSGTDYAVQGKEARSISVLSG